MKCKVKKFYALCLNLNFLWALLIALQQYFDLNVFRKITVGKNTAYLAGFVKRGDIKTSMDNTAEKVEITISNIWQEISSIIANQGDTLTNHKCKIETVIFDGDSNTIIGNPIHLFEGFINNIELTALTFKFEVERFLGGYSTLSPNATYDVNCQCRKFKDSRCAYTGEETSCDKTLTRCMELGNVENFYGFPSLPKEMAN